jgi:hypothetical protein
MKKNTILALVGLGFFGLVIAKIGWVAVVPQIKAASKVLPVIIGLSILRLVMQTVSWAIALRAEGIAASTEDLIGMRLAAQGMGYITPLGAVISEPMKIRLLGGSATVATLVDTGTYWFASGLFGIIGCIAAALLVARSVHTLTLLALLAAIFTGSVILIARPKPLLSPLVRVLRGRCPGWLKKGERIEGAIRKFGALHPSSIRKMFWIDVACQLLLALEVAVVLWILSIPFQMATILVLEVANRGVKMLSGWMPGRLGTDEGGMAGAFMTLGLSSASGLALALTRRTRDLLACAVGFGWLAWKSKFRSIGQEEVALCKL